MSSVRKIVTVVTFVFGFIPVIKPVTCLSLFSIHLMNMASVSTFYVSVNSWWKLTSECAWKLTYLFQEQLLSIFLVTSLSSVEGKNHLICLALSHSVLKAKRRVVMDTSKIYVRGEENLGDWRPRGTSLIEEHRVHLEKLERVQEVSVSLSAYLNGHILLVWSVELAQGKKEPVSTIWLCGIFRWAKPVIFFRLETSLCPLIARIPRC